MINHHFVRLLISGFFQHTLVGGFNHIEKYESQWEGISHILWKIKHVPNHQAVFHLKSI